MEKVLKDLGCDERELSILFTDDREMSELNNRYRGKEGPTNVLAFAMDESGATEDGCLTPRSAMLGDVVISIDRANRNPWSPGKHCSGEWKPFSFTAYCILSGMIMKGARRKPS